MLLPARFPARLAASFGGRLLALVLVCGLGACERVGPEPAPVVAAPAAAPSSAGSPADVPADGPAAFDARSGLVIAEGWELAAAHCGVCHSYQLVTAQRGDATYWRDIIRWMQRTQNLWPIPDEDRLIDYLAANYDETEWGRRPALPPALLPVPMRAVAGGR
ncbi:MAG: hypothetical protein AAF515_19715 [Pseudomonadota bacterium]